MNAKSYYAMTLFLALCGCLNTLGEVTEERPLTLALAQEVWNKSYESPCRKYEMMSGFMQRVGMADREKGTNLTEIAVIKAYLLDEVLQKQPATIDDYGVEPPGIRDYEDILSIALQWDGMGSRDVLMKVANSIARFQPLPEIQLSRVMPIAGKIDDYLKYGPSKPPRLGGITRRWKGPATERVYKVANFRTDYNRSVRQMRESIAQLCRSIIFNGQDKDFDEASRQALWEEFVEVSGLPSENGKE